MPAEPEQPKEPQPTEAVEPAGDSAPATHLKKKKKARTAAANVTAPTDILVEVTPDEPAPEMAVAPAEDVPEAPATPSAPATKKSAKGIHWPKIMFELILFHSDSRKSKKNCLCQKDLIHSG